MGLIYVRYRTSIACCARKKENLHDLFFHPTFSRFILRLTIDRGKIAKTATDEVAEGDGVRWGFR